MADKFTEDLVAFLPNLRRFALSLCRRPDLADDLVQITAERAFAARDRFDPATRLDSWLLRILRNAWIDHTRRAKSQGTEIDIADAPDLLTLDGEKTVEDNLMLGAAGAALMALPEDQREVMILVCVEEFSYKEAAEALGIPIGTVMSRLARGRLTIAEKLGIK
jgi:RNA polymerase sigma-70 factor (ECF subfamily)